ncbi:Uncharacterised protein [Yersinia pekkanenii]|uniref:Uncharacterized protein n=1 Tax=Yersinia pekkanenii TaxID=1288385 RepID=A0A0T9Q846_9GAMM|nr:Uncharacterised protein [Yersinia pekkanenii]CRY68397.1 Uncharacterised protein [Yersinia pekkanenii]
MIGFSLNTSEKYFQEYFVVADPLGLTELQLTVKPVDAK